MTTATDIGTLIERRPELHGGRPVLAGTGMTVHEIVARYEWGLSPEQILETAPNLDLQRIHAALAYYFANRDEIEADFAADDALYTRLEREFRANT